MNTKKKGFTIIELLVCAAAGYFLLTVLFAALWVVYNRLASVREHNATRATVAVAHDIMVRDLQGICCARSSCKKITPDVLIWPVANGIDRGYELDGTGLKRIEGSYDAKTNQWHKAVRSTVLHNVNRCTFEIQGSSSLINTVKVSLSVQEKRGELSDSFIVAPRNRQIG